MFRQAKRGAVSTCVVDAEVVAYDREKGCLLPFQVLSTRKRKVEDGDEEQKVKVILQGFDLIYLNGKSLLQQSLLERRNLLHASFVHSEGKGGGCCVVLDCGLWITALHCSNESCH